MDVNLECPHCRVELSTATALTERQATCPNCGGAVKIPGSGVSPGTTIGGFRVEKELGKGGMGEVLLATQLSMERQVALKILPASMTANESSLQRFYQEVRMLARLEHPNIVTAFEAGEDQGVHYLAMAYVRGETLESRIKQGPLEEKEILRIAMGVADALDYAWRRHQLIHRDIKPANLMIDDENRVLVMDLGLSKSLGEDAGLTLSGQVMGTPYYMSPEQAQSRSDLDHRSDIYSLGATLYYLISGVHPFTGDSTLEICMKHIQEPLPPLRSHNAEISEACAGMIEMMMAKNPGERHEDWVTLKADAERILAGDAAPSVPTAEKQSSEKDRAAKELARQISQQRLERIAGSGGKGRHRAKRQPPAAKKPAQRNKPAPSNRRPLAKAIQFIAALVVIAAIAIIAIRRPRPTSPSPGVSPGEKVAATVPSGIVIEDTAGKTAIDGGPDGFATLSEARDAIRLFRRNSSLPAGGITVWIPDGTYPQSESFSLVSEDSGTPEAPIVYRARHPRKTRLTGSVIVPETALSTVSDPAVLERVPQPAKQHVIQVDLSQLMGTLTRDDYGCTFGGISPAPWLYVGGRQMKMSRWPNEGWAETTQVGAVTGSVPGASGWFLCPDPRVTRWRFEGMGLVHGFWSYDWSPGTSPILGIDERTGHVAIGETSYKVSNDSRKSRRWYALNLLEELDEPGEWCLDFERRVAYVWPPAGTAGKPVTLATLRDPVVAVEEAAHVSLRDLVVEESAGDGIKVTDGEHVSVLGCTVRHVGTHGIQAYGGGHHLIQSCDVYDLGGGGVYVHGGEPDTLTPAGHAVVNCDIRRVGQRLRAYAPGISLRGVGNRVTNCRIHDLPHDAIMFGGNDHRIERNEIFQVCYEINDCGAIYGARDMLARGTVIRENFIHHIGNPWGPGQGAVYTDDGLGGLQVISNVFYRVGHEYPSHGVLRGNGHNSCLYSNNLFIECKAPVGGGAWGEGKWRSSLKPGGNLAKYRELSSEARSLYISRYPELAGAWKDDKWLPPPSQVIGNLGIRSERFQLRGVDFRNNLGADVDPGFVDMEGMDFTLNDMSWIRARLKDFEPIPFGEIGLHKDEFRTELP